MCYVFEGINKQIPDKVQLIFIGYLYFKGLAMIPRG
ncbi:hypothetical protein HMPREF1212_01137 [Parabacteroides sp. HGS0025]|jgi:hypothetical protein|nr:hypothetical protein HMPREF1212_01137 [Parabacteroides sp. HGS0025]